MYILELLIRYVLRDSLLRRNDMNMKKLHRICEILTLCLTCLLLGSTLKVEATDYQTKLTAEELATNAEIQENIDIINQQYEEAANQLPIEPDPKGTSTSLRAAVGTWSWRDGLICVTTRGKDIAWWNTWHAAIVAPQQIQAVVEAPGPGKPVRFSWGVWQDNQHTVYQVAVKPTTVQQDWNAGYWAGKQVGKPYNNNPYNARQTNSFYCSQLVWAAYYYISGVDLNKSDNDLPGKIAIHPGEFVNNPTKTVVVYRNR
jgi:uncharacterized protein YycO